MSKRWRLSYTTRCITLTVQNVAFILQDRKARQFN